MLIVLIMMILMIMMMLFPMMMNAEELEVIEDYLKTIIANQ